MKNVKDYIKKIKFNVPMHKIYKICDSCNYNIENDFCPILVKLGDQMKALNNDHTLKTKLREYLLQVWDKKGRMVYER